jgi:hypothetical protein
MFSHHNIPKSTWTSPDGKTHDQSDNTLIDRRRHSSTLDVRSFRAADCHIDHYLVVAKFMESLAVSKQTTHRVHMEKFNLKKLKEAEGKEQYRVEISNKFAAFNTTYKEHIHAIGSNNGNSGYSNHIRIKHKTDTWYINRSNGRHKDRKEGLTFKHIGKILYLRNLVKTIYV